MGGKNSAESINRYIAKAYDRINLTVPKGQKEIIQAYAEAQGKSVNGFINEAIERAIKKGYRPKFNGTGAFHIAYQFEKLAKCADESDMIISAAACGAFSCELYLKCLLSKEMGSGQPISRTHNIKSLFHKLKPETRKRIIAESHIFHWDAFIEEASNAFEQWRYAYEKESLSISILDVLRLAETIRRQIEEQYISKDFAEDELVNLFLATEIPD